MSAYIGVAYQFSYFRFISVLDGVLGVIFGVVVVWVGIGDG